MNQNSTRIILGVSFLAAAAGFAFYFLTADTAKVRSVSSAKAPSGEATPMLPVPVVPEHSLGWEKNAPGEGDLWAYDLFTPVQISWNAGVGRYEPKGAKPPVVVPFGLNLVALKHPTYRYRLSGLFEATKPADSFIKLLDVTTNAGVSGKIGQTVGPEGGKITLISYESKGVKQPDNSIRKEVYILVKDETLGREIKVTRDVIEFTDKVVATFAAEGSTEVIWTAGAIGDKFDNDAGSFVIKGIDFNGQSVTVEKSLPEDPTTKLSKTLTPLLAAVAAPSPAPAIKK
jgi:hypothetical protein